MCGPFGREGTWTHRAWAALAADLAVAGLPALRFDYPDMGDSADLPRDADAVAAWTGSIAAAVDTLRERTGVRAVSLVGYRLGALLAAQVGRDLPDLLALVLLAPVFSGRAYVRELKLAMADRAGPVTADGMEAHGHWLSSATLAHLDRLRLGAAAVGPPGRPVLLCGDPQSNAMERLAQEFAAAGGAVARASFADAERLQGAAHEIGVPEETFARLVAWLTDRVPATRAAPAVPKGSLVASLVVPNGRETPARFGPDGRGFGIVCEPTAPAPDLPAVLILNTGGNHRAGEARSAVQFARALAASGIASFRIDVSCTGDALPVQREPHEELYSERIAEDVAAALDWLDDRAPGRRRTLFGICSGAYVGLHSALRDPRIDDVIMVNPPKFLLERGESLVVQDAARLRHVDTYRSAAMRPDTWRRVARGEVRVGAIALRLLQQMGARSLARAQAVMPPGVVLAPRLVRAHEMFRRLRARGVRVRLIFGDADAGRNELDSLFGRDGRALAGLGAELRFMTGTDHTLTTAVSRARLLEALDDFLRPPGTSGGKKREAPQRAAG